jgi:hypothetical protein
MTKKAILLLVLAFSGLLARAQAQDGGLIEGDRWAFLVSALFYKESSKFSLAEVYMYIVPSPKEPDGPASLEKFILADVGVSSRNFAVYVTGMEYRFYVLDFEDPHEDAYKAKAYYEGEDAYFTFILVCFSAKERAQERASFSELLDSFTYIRKE